MVFQFARAFRGFIEITHGHCKNTPCNAANDCIFGIHSVAEEITQIACETIDRKSSCEIVFDDGETIGEGKCDLGDRVGSSFGDVIATDADGIEILHLVFGEKCLDVSHHP